MRDGSLLTLAVQQQDADHECRQQERGERPADEEREDCFQKTAHDVIVTGARRDGIRDLTERVRSSRDAPSERRRSAPEHRAP